LKPKISRGKYDWGLVEERVPGKQGLKLQLIPSDEKTVIVEERVPGKQGLKLAFLGRYVDRPGVEERVPGKQGLKPS